MVSDTYVCTRMASHLMTFVTRASSKECTLRFPVVSTQGESISRAIARLREETPKRIFVPFLDPQTGWSRNVIGTVQGSDFTPLHDVTIESYFDEAMDGWRRDGRFMQREFAGYVEAHWTWGQTKWTRMVKPPLGPYWRDVYARAWSQTFVEAPWESNPWTQVIMFSGLNVV